MDADYYKPFMAKAGGLLTGSPDCLIMHHVHFTPTLLSLALKAPVVEVLLLYTSPDSTDEVPTTLTRFLDILAANAEGTTGSAHGWVREELEKDGVEGKLRGYMVAVGWESVDDHMKYRETEAFKESIPLVRQLAKGMSVVSMNTSYRSHERKDLGLDSRILLTEN
jgi:quinol monooxygenase YgiN